MARIIICNLCHLHVEEDKLQVHLVTQHDWRGILGPMPLTALPEPCPQALMSVKTPPQRVPRLSPQGRAAETERNKPKPCKYCKKAFEPDVLIAHMIECKKRSEKKQQVKATQQIIKCKYCHISMTSEQHANHGCLQRFAVCPICGKNVARQRLTKHLRTAHSKPDTVGTKADTQTLPSTAKNNKRKGKNKKAEKIGCPYCKKGIFAWNYNNHINKVCPKRPKFCTGPAQRPSNTCNDPQIAEYLARNPAPDTMGPNGTPQSKYRIGTYGLSGMEYDSWGRGK